MGDVGGNESHTASADTRVTHGIISLNMMKARILAVVAAATLVGGCGNVEVVAPTTLADDAIAAPDPTDDGQAEPTTTIEATTTTQPEPTTTTSTTTTVPVTTTTVLDIACIKTTACQYANLGGVDFSRLKLDFVDFSVAKMAGANFVGANLTNSIFIRTDLSAVNFEGATLKNVDFTAATLTAASFKGANLEGAVLCDVDLTGVLDLTKEQLEKVKKFKTKGKVYCP
ncbi:MAG: pentapeptide repeat-containing protein [Actinobacteria bacterium]|nr:pentapeptide repeat-containing protein [Actinomycetota bacterium]NBY58285.1 pentapeptide repeat-containing protein [Actinomycetota bacterium]